MIIHSNRKSFLYIFCKSIGSHRNNWNSGFFRILHFSDELVCSSHPASFRFHLTMDTLAFGYILPTTGRIRDFNPLETCAARRTQKRASLLIFLSVMRFSSYSYIPQFITCVIPSQIVLPTFLTYQRLQPVQRPVLR